MQPTELTGTVAAGRGLGADLLADERILDRLEELFGVRVVPGTLNVRLTGPFDRGLAVRYVTSSEIEAGWEEKSGQFGYAMVPVLVAGRYRGVAFQADEPGYPEDLLEIMCEVHLRSTLGLGDGDPIELAILPAASRL